MAAYVLHCKKDSFKNKFLPDDDLTISVLRTAKYISNIFLNISFKSFTYTMTQN